MANSIDRTSSIMDLKFNHSLYTTDLKIYSQLAHLKKIDECFGMKEKPLELLRCFIFISDNLTWSLVTRPIFLMRELGTDLKNRLFTF